MNELLISITFILICGAMSIYMILLHKENSRLRVKLNDVVIERDVYKEHFHKEIREKLSKFKPQQSGGTGDE